MFKTGFEKIALSPKTLGDAAKSAQGKIQGLINVHVARNPGQAYLGGKDANKYDKLMGQYQRFSSAKR